MSDQQGSRKHKEKQDRDGKLSVGMCFREVSAGRTQRMEKRGVLPYRLHADRKEYRCVSVFVCATRKRKVNDKSEAKREKKRVGRWAARVGRRERDRAEISRNNNGEESRQGCKIKLKREREEEKVTPTARQRGRKRRRNSEGGERDEEEGVRIKRWGERMQCKSHATQKTRPQNAGKGKKQNREG